MNNHCLEEQRFTLALRGSYSEIYELNTLTNRSTLIFSNSAHLLPVGVNGLWDTSLILAAVVHPEDRAHVAKSFMGKTLRARFAQGCTEVAEEFRRIGQDGQYYWVSAIVVPLHEEGDVGNTFMLLVKDITERKIQDRQQRLQQQYNLALRNIYDEFFECNLTQNYYRIMHHVPNKYVIPPMAGALDKHIVLVAENMIHPEDKERFLHFFDIETMRAKFAQGQEFLMGEFRKRMVSGGYQWAALTLFPLHRGEGDDEIYLVFVMDINARKKAQEIAQQNILLEKQRLADERYRIIIEQTNTLVFEWSRENAVHYFSPELGQRFAGTYDSRNILNIWEEDGVVHPDDLPSVVEFRTHCLTLSHPEMIIRLRTRANTFIWCKVVLSCQCDAQGTPTRYIGTLNDVHEATCASLALHYRAEYDMLTGIFNMQTFYARAEHLLQTQPERPYSIIRMDIDRFKVINDLYGLEAGDLLLKKIARLLNARMSPHSVCGRINADVFCLCVDYTEDQTLAFIREMSAELTHYPLPSRLVPSFGICRVDNRETPINVLCDWAHLALKTVKGNVLVYHAFYDETLRNFILEEKKIESEMHEALTQGQFQLYIQPKVAIDSKKVVGGEGLVRWIHPVEGIIYPDRFIPQFEKNGFVIHLDEYIWERTCMVLRDWLDRGLPAVPVSVNMSCIHIHDTRLCEKLLNLTQKYNLPPQLLELELTESVFLDNEADMVTAIKRLQKHGFIFSLDDFGAGYSSLNMLKSLPINTIKIDRGFLSEVSATERGKTIIRHIISLAKAMNMHIVAEGVENGDQARFLLDAGCAVAQGFYYSPPVPVTVFENMAFDNSPLPSPALHRPQ
ncbi:MAG: EAL domain-containing protein [Desulfovibrionaceae bacterium]